MAVAQITPHLTSLHAPEPIRNLPAWVMWRFEPNDNPGGKPRKVPYYVTGQRRAGGQGTPEDRARLVTFDAARNAAARRGFDGVGFCTLAEFGIVALDFDNCVAGGQVHPEIEGLLSGTYAEYSPSGLGIRAFFRGQLGNMKSHAEGSRYGLELFSSKGFVTYTGNALPGVEALGNLDAVAPVDEPVLAMVQARFKRDLEVQRDAGETGADDAGAVGLTEEQIEQALGSLPEDLDYDTWLSVGMALHHETAGAGFEIWDQWSQRSPKYTSREYGVERWNSFGKRMGPAVTARSLIKLANEHGAGLERGSGVASAADFGNDVAAAQAPTPTGKKNRFEVLAANDFAAQASPDWIVKGILPRADLVVLYGESTAGKSFVALDMGLAIARGMPWWGHRVTQGRVIYVAAEGAGGFRNRLKAYELDQKLKLAEIPFGIVNGAPNLLSVAKGAGPSRVESDAVELSRAIGKADVVIIDTFAQTTPGGNENAGEDMGKALAQCKLIHRATGAVVVLVHHSGKDASKGARGWSGLKAAADAELEVLRDGDMRFVRVSKQKDGEDGLAWGFKLRQVALGFDADDDLVTSCVVEQVELGTKGVTRARKLGEVEQTVSSVITEIAGTHTSGIPVDKLVDLVRGRLPLVDGKRDTRVQRVRRALVALCEGDDALFHWDRNTDLIEIL